MPKTIAPLKKRAKIKELVAFNKSLESKDEVLLAKISDFTKDANGDFVLKKSAAIATFSKSEMDADGYDDEATEGAEPDTIDFEDHANNAAGMHQDMCKMAGIDDHVGHYAQATGDGDSDDAEGEEAAGDEDSLIGKSATARRRRLAFKKAASAKQHESFASMLAASEERIAAMIKGAGLNAAPAVRRESAEGVLVKRAGETLDASTAGDANVVALTKAYRAMNALLLKKASDVDRQERDLIVREVARLEVTLENSPAKIAEAKAAAAA